jgi:thioredoxin-dependent peroxiredoxin
MTLAVGARAPDFTLPREDGTPVRLVDLLKRGPAVVYFYPRDETLGCTIEACGFRDSYEGFTAAGAEVVGISSDSPSTHAAFAKNRRLPFILLSDPEGEVRSLYRVGRSFLGLVPGRVTFVIDPGGVIRHVCNSAVSMMRHVEEALEIVRGLRGGAG